MRAEIKRDCAGPVQRERASDRARRCCKVMAEMEKNEARNSKRRGVILRREPAPRAHAVRPASTSAASKPPRTTRISKAHAR